VRGGHQNGFQNFHAVGRGSETQLRKVVKIQQQRNSKKKEDELPPDRKNN
jgi:hypothetical protein